MMQKPLLIGSGAGLVGATLYASAATGTDLAGILVYLTPLPLFLAGLGWGWFAGLAGAIVGTLAAALVLGIDSAIVFAGGAALPAAVLSYLALMSRSRTTPEGAAPSVEWYPVGHLVGWAALMAGLVASFTVLVVGFDADSFRESIRQSLETSTFKDLDPSLFNEDSIGKMSGVLVRALPAAFSIIWLAVVLFDLWLAGVIVQASGNAIRPWPRIEDLELPNAVFLAFVVALAASFLPGTPGLLATAFAGAFFFAYVLQGLGVLHGFTRGLPFRPLILAAIYLSIALLGWVALAVAIVGLGEPIFRLRERASMRGQKPRAD